MGLGYDYQTLYPLTLIGTKTAAGVYTGNLLTSAYGGAGNTKVFETGGISKVNFSFAFTLGAAETNNVIHMRIRTSADNVNFYQFMNEVVTTGTSTMYQREFVFTGASTAGGPYLFSIPLDVQDLWMELAVCESGVGANYGNVYAEVTKSGTLR